MLVSYVYIIPLLSFKMFVISALFAGRPGCLCSRPRLFNCRLKRMQVFCRTVTIMLLTISAIIALLDFNFIIIFCSMFLSLGLQVFCITYLLPPSYFIYLQLRTKNFVMRCTNKCGIQFFININNIIKVLFIISKNV